MFPRSLISLLALSLFLFSTLAFSPTTSAQTNSGQQGVGVIPSNPDPNIPLTKAWIMKTVEAGKSIEGSVEIQNNNDTESEIRILAKDATQTTDGSFTFKDNSDKDTKVGSWVKLEKDSIKLPPKTSQTIAYTINVPEGTSAGEYAGVISVQSAPTSQSSGVQLVTRVGTRIYITVPGDLKTSIQAKTFEFVEPKSSTYSTFWKTAGTGKDFDNIFVNLDLQNLGNIYTKTRGQLTLNAPFGEFTQNLDKESGSNLPQFNTLIDFNQKWQVGNYKLKLNYQNSPLITLTKPENVPDVSPQKDYEIEFTMTQEILDQMKKDKTATPEVKINPASDEKIQPGFSISETEDTKQADTQSQLIIYILSGIIGLLVLISGYFAYKTYRKNGKEKQLK
jgi:hypothetical protein